jgi:hypothetical protein
MNANTGTPEERVFDRIPRWDVRNDKYRIRSLDTIADKALRSYSWRVPAVLDQGSEGACVGFAFAHELAARPRIVNVDEITARGIYYDARRVDEWVGEDYSGTSVLAGAKVLVERGHFASYRWARTVEELALAVGYAGPAVIGVDWHSGMDTPDIEGFIHATGGIRGGHAILVPDVAVVTKRRSRPYFEVHNSWGPGWGENGRAKISFDDMAKLLAEFGEACIPMGRKVVR